jgi:hypothetical protein
MKGHSPSLAIWFQTRTDRLPRQMIRLAAYNSTTSLTPRLQIAPSFGEASSRAFKDNLQHLRQIRAPCAALVAHSLWTLYAPGGLHRTNDERPFGRGSHGSILGCGGANGVCTVGAGLIEAGGRHCADDAVACWVPEIMFFVTAITSPRPKMCLPIIKMNFIGGEKCSNPSR